MRGFPEFWLVCFVIGGLCIFTDMGCQRDVWHEETYVATIDSMDVPLQVCGAESLVITVYASFAAYRCDRFSRFEAWEDSSGLHLRCWAIARWMDGDPCDPGPPYAAESYRVPPPLPLGWLSVIGHNPDGTEVTESVFVDPCRP